MKVEGDIELVKAKRKMLHAKHNAKESTNAKAIRAAEESASGSDDEDAGRDDSDLKHKLKVTKDAVDQEAEIKKAVE